jgi:hypothetical protein
MWHLLQFCLLCCFLLHHCLPTAILPDLLPMSCLQLHTAINIWRRQQQQQQQKPQRQKQKQQLPLLPASYVQLALCWVLQWTAVAKGVSPPNGDVLRHEHLGQCLHTIVALNAAVLQAWPAAA